VIQLLPIDVQVLREHSRQPFEQEGSKEQFLKVDPCTNCTHNSYNSWLNAALSCAEVIATDITEQHCYQLYVNKAFVECNLVSYLSGQSKRNDLVEY
jgi:hypothetical protein